MFVLKVQTKDHSAQHLLLENFTQIWQVHILNDYYILYISSFPVPLLQLHLSGNLKRKYTGKQTDTD